jgi:hypothetical protein
MARAKKKAVTRDEEKSLTRNDTMKPLAWLYSPRVKVAFSETDIFALFLYSERHYDGLCRAQSQQGGILWGLRNRLENGFAVTYLKTDEADLIGKICEVDPIMCGKMVRIIQACNAEYERLNPDWRNS